MLLTVPLTSKTVDVKLTSNAPALNGTITACENGAAVSLFRVASIITGIIWAIALGIFISFVYLTRNTDINYTIRVKKIIGAYKSYIQQLYNAFDTEGYRVLYVKSFVELLQIRDTTQSPVLMSENEDKTKTDFIVPTNSDLLYVFELKVDNYDEIYAKSEAEDIPAFAPVKYYEQTVTAVEEEAVEENIAVPAPVQHIYITAVPLDDEPTVETEPVTETECEPVAEVPAVTAEENETEDGEDGELFGLGFKVKLDYSFEARLILATEETRGFYTQIVNFARSFGAKVKRSWSRERIYLGRSNFASLVFRGTKLGVALALNPKAYEDTKYRGEDVSEFKRYAGTPLLLRISSQRKVKYATEILEKLFADAGIPEKQVEPKPVKIPRKSKKRLMEENLIKLEK